MAQKNRTVVDPRQAERRRSLIYKILAAVVLVIIAVGVTFWAINSNKEDSSTGGSATPTVLTDGAIRITGAPAGTQPKAVVTVVEDFQCPACGVFEQQFGPTLAELAKQPNVAVDYRTITFLDRGQTEYSANAANASLCVAESLGKNGDMNTWLKFHNLLFTDQRAEGGPGFTDSELNSMANQAGVQGVKQCIADKQFAKWIVNQTAETMKDPGFQGTPWIRLNGKTLQVQDPAQLTEQVNAAAE